MKSDKSQAKNHQNEYEQLRNAQRMRGFNEKESRAYITLTNMYGPKPSHPELLSLAQILSNHLHIVLDREASRRKRVLIKWYEENFKEIEPFIKNYVIVFDRSGNIIGNNPLLSSPPSSCS